jgi:hypothetical protein
MEIVNILEDIRFTNVGEAPPHPGPEWTYSRQWNACVEYGFMSAGQGLVYSQPLLNIKVKDIITAYITGCGYVGVGVVTKKAVKIKDFEFNGKKYLRDFKIDEKILSGELKTNETVEGLPYLRKSLFRNCTNEKTEFVIGVDWIKTVGKTDACWQTGIGLFAKPHIQCSLQNQPETLQFLENCFDVEFV